MTDRPRSHISSERAMDDSAHSSTRLQQQLTTLYALSKAVAHIGLMTSAAQDVLSQSRPITDALLIRINVGLHALEAGTLRASQVALLENAVFQVSKATATALQSLAELVPGVGLALVQLSLVALDFERGLREQN